MKNTSCWSMSSNNAISVWVMLGTCDSTIDIRHKIAMAVEQHYELPEGALKQPSRKAKIANARYMAMYVMCEHFGVSHKAAAAAFKMDRTSAIRAINKVDDEIGIYEDVATDIYAIVNQLRTEKTVKHATKR